MGKELSELVEESLSPTSGRPPWERLKVGRKYLESLKAFEAFVIYRDMGTSRTLLRVQTEYKKSAAVLRWSTLYKWVDRCAEYDDHMDRQALIEQEAERRAMSRRHVALARLLQQKAVQRLSEIKPDKITPAQIPNYLQTAVTIERLAVGESTENTREITSPPVKYIEVHRQGREKPAKPPEPESESPEPHV